jgi:nickel/cobalt transporter (NiCoT) family protein
MAMTPATEALPANTSILSSKTKRRVLSMYGLLAFVNIGAWMWALIAFHNCPVLLGTSLLAYTFGLRHAVDADHIATIDNVTRKLMQQGKRPVAVGFFFPSAIPLLSWAYRLRLP